MENRDGDDDEVMSLNKKGKTVNNASVCLEFCLMYRLVIMEVVIVYIWMPICYGYK